MPRKPAARAPAFQFYPKDFVSAEAVQTMELDEIGAYILLLCVDWNEGSIPDDERKVGRLLQGRANGDDLPRIWTSVRPCFQKAELPGRLTNPRLRAERKKQKKYREKQKANIEKRWGKSPKETDEGPVENSDEESFSDHPGTTPVQDGTKKGEGSGKIDENNPKNTPAQDTGKKEDVYAGKDLVIPKGYSSSSSSSSTTCKREEEESLESLLTTSSLLTPDLHENPEVSPIGEPGRSPQAASSNQDTHTSPKSIKTLAQFKAAKPDSPETVHSLTIEVVDSLSLPDEIIPEIEEIVAGYPLAWTRDCLLTTRDKQQRIAEGVDKTGFTEGPLQYLAGSLEKKLKALMKIISE